MARKIFDDRIECEFTVLQKRGNVFSNKRERELMRARFGLQSAEDVGTQSTNDKGQLISDKKIDDMASVFSVDASKLKEVGKTNDMLRNIKNIYANTDTTSGAFYLVGTSYYFNYQMTAADANLEVRSEKLGYTGLNFGGKTNNSAVSFDTLCTTKDIAAHKTYALIPPAPVKLMNYSVYPAVLTDIFSLSNDELVASDIQGSSCSTQQFFMSKIGDDPLDNMCRSSAFEE